MVLVGVAEGKGSERMSSLMWMMTTGWRSETMLASQASREELGTGSPVTPASGHFLASMGLHPAEMRTSSTSFASTSSSSNMYGGER